jgi:hypothetical protein
MAYSVGALTLLAGQEYTPEAPRIWTYKSTDAMATVRAADYIRDAKLRGMKVGDIVFVTQMTGAAVTAVTMSVVVAVTADGADLSDGTTVTVTNS